MIVCTRGALVLRAERKKEQGKREKSSSRVLLNEWEGRKK